MNLQEFLPKEEVESELCECATPIEYIDKYENLIKCKICNKQYGNKTYNQALKDCREALSKVKFDEKEAIRMMANYETVVVNTAPRIVSIIASNLDKILVKGD